MCAIFSWNWSKRLVATHTYPHNNILFLLSLGKRDKKNACYIKMLRVLILWFKHCNDKKVCIACLCVSALKPCSYSSICILFRWFMREWQTECCQHIVVTVLKHNSQNHCHSLPLQTHYSPVYRHFFMKLIKKIPVF